MEVPRFVVYRVFEVGEVVTVCRFFLMSRVVSESFADITEGLEGVRRDSGVVPFVSCTMQAASLQ